MWQQLCDKESGGSKRGYRNKQGWDEDSLTLIQRVSFLLADSMAASLKATKSRDQSGRLKAVSPLPSLVLSVRGGGNKGWQGEDVTCCQRCVARWRGRMNC